MAPWQARQCKCEHKAARAADHADRDVGELRMDGDLDEEVVGGTAAGAGGVVTERKSTVVAVAAGVAEGVADGGSRRSG